MNTQQKQPKKIVTMAITQQAQDCLPELTHPRGVGELVSELIVEAWRKKKGTTGPSPREIASTLRNLADRIYPE